MNHGLIIGGNFRVEHWYNGLLVATHRFHNGIATAGINDLFDKYFRNGTPPSAWYMGLIGSTGFSALAAGDTMASHAGWTENTDYDEATRPQWSPAAASAGKIENTASVQFTMNAIVTIKGIFVTSDNTKGGTSGILWCTGLFPVDDEMQVGSVERGYYDLTGREG